MLLLIQLLRNTASFGSKDVNEKFIMKLLLNSLKQCGDKIRKRRNSLQLFFSIKKGID